MTTTRRSWLRGAWRRMLPSSLWGKALLVAVPVLLLFAFVNPLVAVLRLLSESVAAVSAPFLRSPAGRLFAVCAALALAGYVAFRLLRERLRALRGGLLLRRHFDALAAWLAGDARRATDLWQRIVKSTAPLPPEYRAVRADAYLKLARLALASEQPGLALAWVLRVPEGLPPVLERAHAQLRARAVVDAPGSLPATCAHEIGSALARFPDDLVLLRLQRDQFLATADAAGAAEVQERIWRGAEPARAAAERAAAVHTWLTAGAEALARRQYEDVERCLGRARAVDADLAAAQPLEGDLRWAQGDVRAALRAWSRVPGSAGLTRAAGALDDGAHGLTPRDVLECFATEGGLLLAARAFARAGDARRALRAAQQAARRLGPSPTVSAVLADVLRITGDPGAAAFAEEAVTRLRAKM
jgi:hypothetical protein